jgi:hypothetical protein
MSATIQEPLSRIEASPSVRSGYKSFLLFSVLILLLATALRVYHISQRSLWLDEAIAANISRGTISQTLTLTRGLHSAPIIDPMMLYVTEKVASGPLAVRFPSFLASLLAVLLMLCFTKIPGVGYKTAALAALMLCVSAAQIRYAQEVREYSLSVLYAAILLYAFLSYSSTREERTSPLLLYGALFFAPLVQYGLVLFSFGILAAMVVLAFPADNRASRIRHIVIASCCLGLGGLLSFFLTLRYQWGDDAWYLKDYFWTRGSGILHFVVSNTHHLITFLLPGLAAAAISIIAILIQLVLSIRTRSRIFFPLATLAVTSCSIVLLCSLLHLYPYGPIRQCLFLSPVLCLLASTSLVGAADKIPGRAAQMAFAAIVCIVVASGFLQIRLLKPYAEIEDIQPLLLSLQSQIQTGDRVYVYPGAVFAVDYYVKTRDPRFIYGDYHQQAPEKYADDISSNTDPQSKRLWVVFSHIYRDEDQRILSDLNAQWTLQRVMSAEGVALYSASRRDLVPGRASSSVASSAPGSPAIETSKTALATVHTQDSFWQWNLRNARQSIR